MFLHGHALQTRMESAARRRVLACGEWCPGAESNHRHCDFQSHALPTELPGHPQTAEAVEVAERRSSIKPAHPARPLRCALDDPRRLRHFTPMATRILIDHRAGGA